MYIRLDFDATRSVKGMKIGFVPAWLEKGEGKAVVSAGTRESMERDAEILHGYGLWATVSHDR